MSDWADDGTCSEQCGGGLQKKRRFIETANAFGGIECSLDVEKDVECNIHLCPVQPIGEQGIGEFAIEGAMLLQGTMATTAQSAWVNYQLNGNYGYPAIFGGVPTADAVVQVANIKKKGVQENVPTCPLHLTSPLPQGNLLPITIKDSKGDFCTGIEGANVCHDNDADGGERLGFLFREPIIGMESDFVELKRYVYSDEFDDTCTGVEGTMHSEQWIDGVLTPVEDCWGTQFSDSIGYIFKKDTPQDKRPGTVALVKVTVQTLCGSIRQWLYQYDQLEGRLVDGTKRSEATEEQYLTMGKERLESTMGYKPEELEEMTAPDVLAVLVENQMKFGVDCKMEDICTGLAGKTDCHLPPGDAEEDLVGFIVGTDVTEDPADNWGSCQAALMCPIVYTEPVPAQLIEVAKKEVPEGEDGVIKCAGDATNLPCGDDDDPMGGNHLGFLFAEVLLGIEMVPVTEGMLLKPKDDSKQKEVGFAFKQKQQGTTEINGVYLVTEGFKEMYAQCGFFSDKQKKWNFGMKIEFKPDKIEDPSVKSSFMVFNSGVYETRDLKDETKKMIFQVGTAKVSASAKETEIKFHEEFDAAPMVISSVQTYNSGKMVQTRQLVAPADGKSFLVKLEGPDDDLKDEWIAWIAMQKGSGKLGDVEYDAVETGDEVGADGKEVDYTDQDLAAAPNLFGSIATKHGEEPAHLAVVESDLSSKKAKIGAINDNFEGGHANEKASILVMKSTGMQPAVMNGWLLRKVSYSFVTGNWGGCSHVCGEGKIVRDVHCVSSIKIEPVGDHYCYGDKPATEKPCGFECKWQISDWSVCPGKGADEKVDRTVHCQKENSDMLDDKECEVEASGLPAKPPTEQDCCNPKTAADFEGKQCGSVANGCSKVNAADIALGECGADWDCEENMCKCNEKAVVLPTPHTPIVTDYLNVFGGLIDYACAPGSVLTGIGSAHSDPDEDRKFKYTCSTLASPVAVGPVCVEASICGGKENGEAKCPAGFVLTGLKAVAPVGEDRTYNFKCCELLGVVVDEEGSGDMSATQAEFDYSVTGGKVLTGVTSDYDKDKVDRKFQFHWTSFKTKKHCESCTTTSVAIPTANVQFPANPDTKFNQDYDFSCPAGEILQGVESVYEAPRHDGQWKIKCAKVNGTEVSDGGSAKPAKCGAPLDGDLTEIGQSWYLECPQGEVITKIVSKYDQVTQDRQYQIKCSKFAEGSKLRLKGDVQFFPKDGEATWTYNAGADTGITAMESNFVQGSQRTFKFYGSTFYGPEECHETWVKPQLQGR
jgi:hypothetical protein